jgi:competence ComEA-like helix-hairpin-helix protein
MKAEFERDPGVEPEAQEIEERVDLNLTDVPGLATVPGIGSALASRIIAYRQEHGPFLLPEEVTAVPGIGPSTYQEMRAHIKATLPEELPLPREEETEESEGAEGTEVGEEGEATEEEEGEEAPLVTPPAPQPEDEGEEEEATAEAAAQPTAEDEEVAHEEAGAEAPAPEEPEIEPEFERALPPPEPGPSAPPPPAAEVPASLNRRLWITGVLAAFVGGVLGMIFVLLVFAGLNGSLDLNQTEAIVGLRTELDGVTVDLQTLSQDVRGLRQRLDALEGLTARMDEAESAVETLQDNVSGLQDNVTTLQDESAALQQEVEALSDNLATFTEDVEKATTFFERLRALIIDVFGEAPASTSPASDE